jgi:acyl transferase domain-containing protein/NAD(P)-dependent dehydrogenase (short-subunit alcohol dehydrogenase family)
MNTDQHHTSAVAIIGIGCIFAKSPDLKSFMHLLSRGISGISDPPPTHRHLMDYFDPDPKKPDHIYCNRGGFLPLVDFDPTEFNIPPNTIEATDTSQLLGLVTAKKALEDAGYGENGKSFDRSRASVILGVTGTQELVIPLGARLGHPIWKKALAQAGVPKDQADRVVRHIAEGYVDWQENSFPGLLGNVVAGRIANRLDLGGTNCVVDAACASSMGAIHLALLELRSGRSDMVITGGVDTINDAFMHMCFSKTQILSISGDIRPFSKDADGTVLGEGIGLVVLKRLTDAEKDGDRIYAVIKGLGSSSDGRSQSIYAPRPAGQVHALRRAYQEAGIDPATVGLVEAHGTGTRVGDQVEVQALCEVFAELSPNGNRCALGSVKSNIGHTKAAAGTAGLIKAALAVYHKMLPPTLKADAPDPKLGLDHSPFYINTKLRPWLCPKQETRKAGVSAFGFGGSNFHAVLEEHSALKREPSWDGSIEIIAFSGSDAHALERKIRQWATQATDRSTRPAVGDLARESRESFNAADPERMVMVLDLDGWPDGVTRTADAALKHLAQKSDPGPLPIFRGQGERPGRLAFLFPGQGSQYVGMGRDLICCFPGSFDVFEDACRSLKLEKALEDYVYPRILSDADLHEEQLRQTQIAQPAIGAISVAMLSAVDYFGIKPDATCGHSFGELVALHAAGWIAQKQDLWELAQERGLLMADAGRSAGESGAMLAVRAPITEIELLARSMAPDIVLANRNSPDQGVLSGTRGAIRGAAQACQSKGWRTIQLPVSAAFHSPLVAQAQAPFDQKVRSIKIHPSAIPVMSNALGGAYPNQVEEIQHNLGIQLSSPVDFLSNIEQLYRSGVRTFFEIGPKAILTGLVRSTLCNQPHQAVAIDRSAGRNNGLFDLACALAQLAALGYEVRLDRWEKPRIQGRQARMTIPLSGANYRNPRATQPQATARSVSQVSAATGQSVPHAQTEAEKSVAPPPKTAETKSHFKPDQEQKMDNHAKTSLQGALWAVQQGLSSLQALQTQTSQAHQKFLETQAEASRTLQMMIQSARQLAASEWPNASSAPAWQPPLPEERPAIASPASAVNEPQQYPSVSEKKEIAALPAAPVKESKAVSQLPPVHSTESTIVQQCLLGIVSGLTGYPVEMLGLDMDIESDLGIDSIKRVEILSALEEKMPDLPQVTPDMMGTLKTLGQICDYLSDQQRPDHAPDMPSNRASSDAQRPDIQHTLLDIVGELTGYPVEMLGLHMDIESDLGIDSIKRVEILSALEERMPHLPSVTPDMMGQLNTLGRICDFLAADSPVEATIPSGNPEPAQPMVAPSNSSADETRQTLLEIVSQLTGYPVEMLGLDMDIESDLGIDSIKRVEILSALEERMPQLPKVTPDLMGTLKTLNQIIAYLDAPNAQCDSLPGKPELMDQPELEQDQDGSEGHASSLNRRIVQPCALALTDDNPWVLPQGDIIAVSGGRDDLAAELITALNNQGMAARAFSDLDQLQTEQHLAGLVLLAPMDPAQTFLWAQTCAPFLNDSDKRSTCLIGVSFMDGAFGFSHAAITDPAQGALAGLIKTAAIEWPKVRCLAVDVDPKWEPVSQLARNLALEISLIHTHSETEIGLSAGRRVKLSLIPAPLEPSKRLELTPADVVVVSGGARGVTASAAKALAENTPCILALLGRSPAPQAEPQWLVSLEDEHQIKQAILERQFSGQRPSPRDIEQAYRFWRANRQIQTTLSELKQLGASAHYYSTDVTDADAVQHCMELIKGELGEIKALIHGAGVLEDRLIVDKQQAQFEKVYNTKVGGLRNLLAALDIHKLNYLVLFSSISARLGNQGQVDYAMANEVLNKTAHQYACLNPHCKVISIAWGPWDGGMVTPSLKRNFLRHHVGLIPPVLGAAAMIAEMSNRFGSDIEVVIDAPQDGPVIKAFDRQPLTETSTLSVTCKREVDVDRHPVLQSHLLDGRPVVPFALITEWLAHSALHANPGLYLHGMDNLRLFNGITLDHQKRTICLMAGKASRSGAMFEVDVEIRDDSMTGINNRIHSSARAILAERLPMPPPFVENGHFKRNGCTPSVTEIYEKVLFHGHDLRGIQEIIRLSEKGISASLTSAPPPIKWMEHPLRSRWIADPLVLDCAFQMAIIWCHAQLGMVSLPSFAASYRQYCDRFPSDGIIAVLEVRSWNKHKLSGDFTFLDKHKKVLASLEGYEAIMTPELSKAFKAA